MFTSLLNPLAIIMSLSTATGVLVHDTHIDAAVSLPSVVTTVDDGGKLTSLTGATHIHAERGSLTQAIHDLSGQNPRIQPRAHDDRKHLLQRHASRGHHAFDNYNLPIV